MFHLPVHQLIPYCLVARVFRAADQRAHAFLRVNLPWYAHFQNLMELLELIPPTFLRLHSRHSLICSLSNQSVAIYLTCKLSRLQYSIEIRYRLSLRSAFHHIPSLSCSITRGSLPYFGIVLGQIKL